MESMSRWLVGSSRRMISGLDKQKLAKCHTGFLAAGECAHLFGKFILLKAKAF